jgi:DNA-3-methyladenine glycosylase II
MEFLPDPTLRRHLRKLAEIDDDVAAALDAHGFPPPRRRAQGFPTILRIILGQQVSSAAAAGMWRRLTETVTPEPRAILGLDETSMRGCGFSRQKALYARGLAEAVLAGRLDLDRVAILDDEEAIAELVTLKGVGRWTAEVYLLFALGRPDVWPVGDLAVQEGARRLKRLRRRPDQKQLMRLGERWRPYRSAAAQLLWHYYAKGPVE